MGRLPFDPSKMAGAKPAPTPAAPDRITVSQLAALIDRALRDRLPTGLKVLGEIGQFRERTHWYFDLKDSGAVVSCVMFAAAARKAGFTPKPGLQVVATGRVEYYQPQGRTQFMVDRLEPVGAALDLEFRRLCDELRGLGWFAEERKRPLPTFPRRVAVVTSRTGAALQDVLDTMKRRCPAIPIGLVDVRVQGEDAKDQVARAIRRLGAAHERLGVDVILVTRGGGSMEDLWTFNERIVAQAIVECPIPVVAAIGHETDTTIAELVADLRCSTPTQAAMRIAPDAAALRRQLASIGGSLTFRTHNLIRGAAADLTNRSRHARMTVQGRVQHFRGRLERLSARLERHRPTEVYAKRRAALDSCDQRLRAAINGRLARRLAIDLKSRLDAVFRLALERRRALLEAAGRGLDLVGPHNVLRRGFSMTLRADGSIIRSTGEVRAGETVQTRLADGSFGSVVQPGAGVHGALRAMPTASTAVRRSRRGSRAESGPGLFGPPG